MEQSSEDLKAFKKSMILELVALSMDWRKAALLAECSIEQMDDLENDEEFQAQVEIVVQTQIKDYLRELKDAAIRAARAKGDTKGLMNVLSLLDPNSYGKTLNLNHRSGSGRKNNDKVVKIEFIDTPEIEPAQIPENTENAE